MVLEKRGYAKINLALDVTGKREDGYHLVRMIMQTVDLYDVLTFTIPEDAKGADITLTGDHDGLLMDESNLIYKAAKLLADTCPEKKRVRIRLQKNIPIAAGMAGGSTDAAATLLGLNELWNLQKTKEELCELGVKLGADVPYCIMGGTALAENIGEKLMRLAPPPEAVLLIAKPAFGVSTKYVYEQIDREGIAVHPDIDGMIEALNRQDLQGITDRLMNVLELVTEKEYPQITEIKNVMTQNGAGGALMSGSGPTVFGIFQSREDAESAQRKIRQRQLADQMFVTGFYHGDLIPG